ncbi:hypothetical protein FB45DRAFT_1039766 [Roridomyces roridus]|uniref:Uncharacterized protein n=1 Tax=Roridomyces roridus TaxID=1738132 RepID=A0AAD7B2W5_9AGAR|nr:hypothetical protein FB45DRAFT_1039766 [Roridomyces roridus]
MPLHPPRSPIRAAACPPHERHEVGEAAHASDVSLHTLHKHRQDSQVGGEMKDSLDEGKKRPIVVKCSMTLPHRPVRSSPAAVVSSLRCPHFTPADHEGDFITPSAQARFPKMMAPFLDDSSLRQALLPGVLQRNQCWRKASRIMQLGIRVLKDDAAKPETIARSSLRADRGEEYDTGLARDNTVDLLAPWTSQSWRGADGAWL